MKQTEKQIEGITLRVKGEGEQREKTEEDMNRNRREREDLEKRLKVQEERGGTGAQRGTQQTTMYSTPIGTYSRRPKFPLSAAKGSHWQ